MKALTELAKLEDQPASFETHELIENKNVELSSNIQNESNQGKSESPVNLINQQDSLLTTLNNGGNLPAADQLNPRFELPPSSQFPSSRTSNAGLSANALETALSGYGGSVRKSPQFPTDSSSYTSNAPASLAANYQRQPQMISVLSGGASLHQSVQWNPPATLNPPQSASVYNPNNPNTYSSSSSSSSSSSQQSPFNSFNSAPINNEQFVPSTPPKIHETNDFSSHEVHVNSRPHTLHHNLETVRERELSNNSPAPLQNLRSPSSSFDSHPQPSPVNEKPIEPSSGLSASQAAKPKPAHTVVKNGDGKKDDVVIYYYYYYDDDKNKTVNGGSTANPVDIIPSLDQYDNTLSKRPSAPVVETTSKPTPIVPVHQPNKQATEFKIDGNTFKFDTTGFTPITTTSSPIPYSNNNNNLFRSPDRSIHVHNPLHSVNNGKFRLAYFLKLLLFLFLLA